MLRRNEDIVQEALRNMKDELSEKFAFEEVDDAVIEECKNFIITKLNAHAAKDGVDLAGIEVEITIAGANNDFSIAVREGANTLAQMHVPLKEKNENV